MVICKDVFYVESPFQLLSAIPHINNTKQTVILYKKVVGTSQLKNTIRLLDKEIQTIEIKNIIHLLSKILFIKINKVFLGDVRYVNSILIYFFTKGEKFLLDDGTYSVVADQGGDLFINTRGVFLKYFFVNKIYSDINRATIMSHEITRGYSSVTRKDIAKTNIINKEKLKDELKLFENSLIYVFTGLNGIVDSDYEKSIFKIIKNYCNEKKLNFILVKHRKIKREEIENIFNDKKIQIVSLKYPIEFYYMYADKKNISYAFVLTTAFFTAISTLKKSRILWLKINQKIVNDKFCEFVNVFNENSIDLLDSRCNRVEILNIE